MNSTETRCEVCDALTRGMHTTCLTCWLTTCKNCDECLCDAMGKRCASGREPMLMTNGGELCD
jgi:hypothetical protein